MRHRTIFWKERIYFMFLEKVKELMTLSPGTSMGFGLIRQNYEKLKVKLTGLKRLGISNVPYRGL